MTRSPDFFDMADADERPEPSENATCKRCGKEDLEWVDIGCGRWRLYDGMKPHVCEPSLEGF